MPHEPELCAGNCGSLGSCILTNDYKQEVHRNLYPFDYRYTSTKKWKTTFIRATNFYPYFVLEILSIPFMSASLTFHHNPIVKF